MNSLIFKLLLSFCLPLVFAINSNAQYRIEVTNNTGCTWTLDPQDAFNVTVGSAFNVGTGFTQTDYPSSGTVDHLVFSKSGCTPVTFGSSGVFTYTSVTATCVPVTCNVIGCSGAMQNAFCWNAYLYLVVTIN